MAKSVVLAFQQAIGQLQLALGLILITELLKQGFGPLLQQSDGVILLGQRTCLRMLSSKGLLQLMLQVCELA